MSEIPRRVAPSSNTVRQLYLKSGNRCAFPGCSRFLFNESGVFVGEICHIKAAMPGGERFDPAQTNVERASFENLLLMCHDHHVETDNVELFDVDRMRRIKSDHERRYSDVVGKMLLTVADHTKAQEETPALNLRRMNLMLNWNNSDQELRSCIADLNEFSSRLRKVPIPAREALQIIAERSMPGSIGAGLETPVSEVLYATGLSIDDLRNVGHVLERHGFIKENGSSDGVEMIGLCDTKEGWPIFADLKSFCAKSGVDLGVIVVGLDFSVLDEC